MVSIYVGGIPFDNCTEQQIREHFGLDDSHAMRVLKGFCFINGYTEQEREAFIATYDGTNFEGRSVNVAIPRRERRDEPR